MSTYPGYTYDKLTLPSSVRLLKLIPGSFGDQLRCEINTTQLDDKPSYEALSYVWGSIEDPQTIEVISGDGIATLFITQNLSAALQRVRKSSADRILWVDSDCIDQDPSSLDERHQQVRLMGQIYRSATAVLIWLGDSLDKNESWMAIKCMKQLKEVDKKAEDILGWKSQQFIENDDQVNSWLGITRAGSTEVCERVGIAQLESPEFRALRALLNSPWFGRAWTWQESFLARKGTFHFGEWVVSDVTLRMVIIRLVELWRVSGLDEFLPPHYPQIMSMVAGFDFWTRTEEKSKQQMRLPLLLAIRRGSGCTIPSDLVYSLLGSAWECPPIEINYEHSTEMVFARTIAAIIDHEQSLSVLGMVEKDRLEADIPSWVPDWRGLGLHTGMLSMYSHQYTATSRSRPVIRLSSDARRLTIQGLRLDTIVETESALAEDVEDWIARQYAQKLPGHVMYGPTKESLKDAYRRVTCLDLTDFEPESPETRWKADSAERFECIRAHFSDGEDGRRRYASLLFSLIEKGRSRSIFMTDHGHLGMATNNIRGGDIVTLLLGGELPLILRPVEGVDIYTFVGECYLHGFMDGEGLVEARRQAQPEYDSDDQYWLQRLHEEPFPVPTRAFTIC